MKQWIRFFLSKLFLKTLIFSGLFVILVGVCVMYWMSSTTRHGETVQVPDVRLMSLNEAANIIDSLGLTYEVIDSTHYVPGVPEGAVVELFPGAFAHVKLGRKLMLSTNPSQLPKYPIPNFKDQLVSYVITKFEQKGMLIDSLVLVPDLSHDLVLKVVDAKGKIVKEQELYPTESHFTLFISGGQGNAEMYLPDLMGLRLDQAKQALMTYSLNVGAVIYTDDIQDSTEVFVNRQYPVFEADMMVPAGSSVDLWLTSEAPAPVQEPSDTTNL